MPRPTARIDPCGGIWNALQLPGGLRPRPFSALHPLVEVKLIVRLNGQSPVPSFCREKRGVSADDPGWPIMENPRRGDGVVRAGCLNRTSRPYSRNDRAVNLREG